MKKIFCKIILSIMRWKILLPTKYPDKCVIIMAPHTSNWDFVVGRCCAYAIGLSPKYMAKSELFIPILRFFIKLNGGIPIDRSKKGNIVDQMVNLFNVSEKLALAIAPEGTRKRVNKWKSGFYHIAMRSNVPIVLMKIDYSLKEVGFITSIKASGDYKSDLKIIQNYYKDISPKYKEKFNSDFK